MPDVRTLLVDLSERFGGASARALGLLGAFPKGEVALASLEGSQVTDEGRRTSEDVFVVARRKFDPRIPWRLLDLVRSEGFDVLDAQNVQSKVWCTMAARRAPVALVSTLNSWYLAEHGGSLRGRTYQALERMTAGATDLYIAVSQDIEERLIEDGASPETIRYIPNAVSLEPPSPEGNRDWLHDEFGVPRDARVCCAVGRLVEAKAFDRLIDAIRALDDPSLHCLIVGDGSLRESLATRAALEGVQDHVHLVGFRQPQEVKRIVQACDIFVLSSTTEGTPVALLEAAALSRPIVATRVGGIPDVLRDGEHAFLVDPGDSSQLAMAIRDALQRPDAASELGRNARQRIAENFSVESQVGATRAAYRQALQRAQG
jgi:glycosyltransferase involved in cell wall biosynthesis